MGLCHEKGREKEGVRESFCLHPKIKGSTMLEYAVETAVIDKVSRRTLGTTTKLSRDK